MRHAEPAQSRLGFGAASGGGLVADFTTGAGARTGMRGNTGGMVVGLHLHQDVSRLVNRFPNTVYADQHSLSAAALDHRGVVAVGRQHALRRGLVRQLDHLEQRQRLLDAVYGVARVENLVAAMLGIDLREHHQLGVGRVAAGFREMRGEILDFLIRQRQAPVAVRFLQRSRAAFQHIHRAQTPPRL